MPPSSQMCLCGLWNFILPVTVAVAAVLRRFHQPMRHFLSLFHGSVAASGMILALLGEHGSDVSATRRRLCCRKIPFFVIPVLAHVLESMVSWPWPRMPNCLLLGHGRCVLRCGCRPPCEAGLSSASSSLHRCMVGPRSMLPCLEACLQGDQATSTPGGSRRKSQKEPGGARRSQDFLFWGAGFWPDFLFFVCEISQGGQKIAIPF